MFNSNWMDFCKIMPSNIPYYDEHWWKCWPWSWWTCTTNSLIVMQDNKWLFYFFNVVWSDQYTKRYQIKEVKDTNVIC